MNWNVWLNWNVEMWLFVYEYLAYNLSGYLYLSALDGSYNLRDELSLLWKNRARLIIKSRWKVNLLRNFPRISYEFNNEFPFAKEKKKTINNKIPSLTFPSNAQFARIQPLKLISFLHTKLCIIYSSSIYSKSTFEGSILEGKRIEPSSSIHPSRFDLTSKN